MREKNYKIFLLLIVMAAALLRFYRLPERGIFMSDEGFYLNGAKTIHAVLEYGWKRLGEPPQDLPSFQEYLATHGGGYPDNGKPGYFFLVTLSFFLWGPHDYAALYLSACLGTLTVLLISFIGKKTFDARVGLWAGLIMAVSPYHINYSRSALSIASAVFFAIAGIFFYLCWEEKERVGKGFWELVISGSLIGFAYTCHYSLFWFLLFMIAFHAGRLFQFGKSVSQTVKREITFSLAIVFPILLLDIPYRVAGKLLEGSLSFSTGRPYYIKSYLTQIRDQFFDAGGVHFIWVDALFYLRLLLTSEGVAVACLSLLGFVLLARTLKDQNSSVPGVVLGMAILPLALFNFYVFRVARSIALVIPAMALLSAFAIEQMNRGMRLHFLRKTVLFATFWVVLFTGIDRSAVLVHARANTREAYALMKSQGGAKCISSQPPNATFYLGKDSVYPLWQLTWEEAKQLYEKGNYRYLLLDSGKFFSGRNEDSFFYEIMHSGRAPVFTVNFTPFRLLLLDYIFTGEKLFRDPTIQVYDLKEIFEG